MSFDVTLKKLTRKTAEEFHAMMESGMLPKARYRRDRCDRCSLLDACQPKPKSVIQWLKKCLTEETE